MKHQPSYTLGLMLFGMVGIAVSPADAWATGLPTIPEPDVLGLLAIGAAAGAVIWLRNRRNKNNKNNKK